MRIVSHVEFERQLDLVRDEVKTPEAGLFGPGSSSWRYSRESALMLAGGRASLLQLAHPFVAQAVYEHSETRTDPVGRFRRTFESVFGMTFGTLDDALDAARHVRGIHDGIGGSLGADVEAAGLGTRYLANDADALFWVNATLVDSSMQMVQLLFPHVGAREADGYYQETLRFVRLFGVDPDDMPSTWSEFRSYWADMLRGETLTVGSAAKELAGFLLTPPNRRMMVFSRWYRTLTIGLMPHRLRESFDLPFERRHRLAFDTSIRALRRSYRHLPGRLRFQPAYFEALRRVEGRGGRDRVGRAMESLILRNLEPNRTMSAARCPVGA